MKSIHLLFLVALIIFLLNSCNKDNAPVVSVATSAKFYKSSFSLAVGGREKVMLTLDTENATLRNPKWISTNTVVAKVDSSGIVKALAVGEATISLKADNNISGSCKVIVVDSPIKNLVMPEAKYPLAKDALIFIFGKGFTSNSKIILRPHSDYKHGLKSASVAEDILAQIYETTANYISLYLKTNPGLYDVILNEQGEELDLGNIEIETPNLPEYEYDKNKIFWEDTHWRRFQLRGKVKNMKITNIYYPIWTHFKTYFFNNKGYLESYSNDYNHTLMYKYDNYNRLISKDGICNIQDNNNLNVDHYLCEYTYGDHNFYIPISHTHDLFTRFEPEDYQPFYTGGDYTDMLDLEMYAKGLIGIKCDKHFTTGNIESKNYQFDISSNSVKTTFDLPFVWKYQGAFPFEETVTGYEDITKMKFSSTGIPIKTEDYETLNYIIDCPFNLIKSATYNGYTQFTCEYDQNWNVVRCNDLNGKTDFHYISYDLNGNWTECIVIRENSLNKLIFELNRDITYW